MTRFTWAWTDEDGEQAFVDLRDAVTAVDARRVIQETASHEGWEPICWHCSGLPRIAWWRPADHNDMEIPDPEISYYCDANDYRRRGRSWTVLIDYRGGCACDAEDDHA